MGLRSLAPALAVALALLAAAVGPAAGAADRLERFRALAATRLAAAQLTEEPAGAEREMYALLDEEIVESLALGSIFASLEFLQDRLDAFGEVWGSTVVRLTRVGRLLVGAFQLSDGPHGNSVRVYGQLRTASGAAAGSERSEAALLTALSRTGRPTVYPVDPRDGQFLVVWEGPPTGRGTRELRVEFVREDGNDVRIVWSTAELFPDRLHARRWHVRGRDIRVQYEVQYPGWAPGCDGQTEQADVYRIAPGTGAVTRVSREQVNGWHREFRLAVHRLMEALAGSDTALESLVPDATLRQRLPRTLEPEPACDAREAGPDPRGPGGSSRGATPERVSVAARDAARPWQLVFQRAPAGWRLVRATPVLQ